MCTIWGYAQGWWTVVGLLSDIFGFAILAVDLGREYMRHRRAVNLEEGAQMARWLLDHPEEPKTEIAHLMRSTREMLLRASEFTGDETGSIRALDSLEDKIQAFQLKAREERAKPFKRAPIFTGVSFVILGFILQVIGAIPCQ